MAIKANVNARAGEAISGNLYRGAGGQFQAGPGGQLRQRLEAIRARRQASKQKRAKGRARPKKTDAQRVSEKEALRQANQDKVLSTLGIGDEAASTLLSLAAGEGGGGDDFGLIEQGLVERDSEGNLRLSSQGRAFLQAAGRGNVGAARDAMSRGRDREKGEEERATRKQERTQAAEARGKEREAARIAREEERERKKEERQSRGGGGGGKEKGDKPDRNAEREAERAENRTKALKKVKNAPDADGMSALGALSRGDDADPKALSKLKETGLVEEHDDGSYTVTPTGRSFMNALDRNDPGAANDALARAKDRVTRKAEREAERTERERQQRERERRAPPQKEPRQTTAREKAGRESFGLGRKAMDQFIDILEEVIDLTDDALMVADAEVKAGRVLSTANAGRVIDALEMLDTAVERLHDLLEAAGLTEEEGESEGGMGMPMMTGKSAAPYAVKALDGTGDRIGGYAVIFGDESAPDLSPYRDFFTPDTDFWLAELKTRPMLYHHAMEERTAADPVVGTWDTARVDDTGVWLEGELKKRHAYKQAIKELIARGELGQSSDSAPHLVKRKRQPNGTHKVVRWPLLASSLTVTPAEPRMLPVDTIKAAYKAIGLDLNIDDASTAPSEGPSGGQSDDERARRLNTLIHILELEAQIG